MEYGGSSFSGDMLLRWKWYILFLCPIFELQVGVVVILSAWLLSWRSSDPKFSLAIVPWLLSLILFPESRYDMRNNSFRVLEFIVRSYSCLLLYQMAHRKRFIPPRGSECLLNPY
jgi:hypothetical protein